jgi:HK97 family phage major capsid protein
MFFKRTFYRPKFKTIPAKKAEREEIKMLETPQYKSIKANIALLQGKLDEWSGLTLNDDAKKLRNQMINTIQFLKSKLSIDGKQITGGFSMLGRRNESLIKEEIETIENLIQDTQDRATRENRALTSFEANFIKASEERLGELRNEIPVALSVNRNSNFGNWGQGSLKYPPDAMLFETRDGETVAALPVKRNFSALEKRGQESEGIGPGSLGKILRAKILGDSMGLNLNEFRALGESVGGAGGWFVSPQLSSYVIDLARNKSCVLLAGGWSLPMTTEEMTLIKILTDPTAYWVAEHAKITESEGTFGPIKLKAVVVGCLVRVSRALLEDAPNSGNVIESQIGAALGLEIDRVSLLGNGVNTPKGLMYCADINTYSMGANGAALTNYDPFSVTV